MASTAYEVVWPLGKSVYETVPLADRSQDLDGKTVCELWDWIFRGDEMFPVLRKGLANRYPGIKFVDYSHFGNTYGRNQREVIAELPELLKKYRCDAVISGVGA